MAFRLVKEVVEGEVCLGSAAESQLYASAGLMGAVVVRVPEARIYLWIRIKDEHRLQLCSPRP